jgi:hypothetical protein
MLADDIGIALVIVIVIVLMVVLFRKREGFSVSPEAHELCRASRETFNKKGGNVSYTEFKESVGRLADPVTYADTRTLYLAGKLRPEEVQRVLA